MPGRSVHGCRGHRWAQWGSDRHGRRRESRLHGTAVIRPDIRHRALHDLNCEASSLEQSRVGIDIVSDLQPDPDHPGLAEARRVVQGIVDPTHQQHVAESLTEHLGQTRDRICDREIGTLPDQFRCQESAWSRPHTRYQRWP